MRKQKDRDRGFTVNNNDDNIHSNSYYLSRLDHNANQFGGFRFLAMLRRWIHMLGLVRYEKKESKWQKQHSDTAVSLDLSRQLRKKVVRIVHAGGREELYHDVIPASRLMEKYPGMHVAHPEIFKHPLESLLSAEEYLIPGQKYYLIPSTTAEKLKRRYLHKKKMKQLSYNSEEPILAIKDVADVGAECSDESVCSAKDFYASREWWFTCSQRKPRKEKPFVPPIQKARTWKELEWEPSLTSIQEVSP